MPSLKWNKNASEMTMEEVYLMNVISGFCANPNVHENISPSDIVKMSRGVVAEALDIPVESQRQDKTGSVILAEPDEIEAVSKAAEILQRLKERETQS